VTIKKPIRIHKVKSYKSFPKDKDGARQDSSVKAMAFPSSREVYVVKGKTPESDKQHEVGHVVHRDSDNWPYKPEVFVRSELRATLYSYKKTKAPTHILSKLRAIFNDLYSNHYGTSARESLSMIRKALRGLSVPKAWLSDYQLLRQEVIKTFGWKE
jgi:hypothetical protein